MQHNYDVLDVPLPKDVKGRNSSQMREIYNKRKRDQKAAEFAEFLDELWDDTYPGFYQNLPYYRKVRPHLRPIRSELGNMRKLSYPLYYAPERDFDDYCREKETPKKKKKKNNN
jgi:hypothetical protein